MKQNKTKHLWMGIWFLPVFLLWTALIRCVDVQAACRWAFLHPDVRSLEAETDAENAASQRVLEKCGFRPNGTFGEEGPRFTLGRLDAAKGTR